MAKYMIGTLYRYSHPQDSTKFIYVGQGSSRDKEHRSGRIGFGRRFKKRFLGMALPEPIKETINVSDQFELNEEEIIWMFRYRTWHGYPAGMNLTLPIFDDYKNLGKLSGSIQGPKNVENGHMERMRKKITPEMWVEIHRKGGLVTGNNNIKTGHIQRLGRENIKSGRLASVTTKETCAAGGRRHFELYGNPGTFEGRSKVGRIYGRITCCLRWNIRRGKPCVCGNHLQGSA